MQTVLFIGLIILAFLVLGPGALFVFAKLGGWASLVRAYRYSGPLSPPPARATHCRLIRMRWEGSEESLIALFPRLPLDLNDEIAMGEVSDLHIGAGPEGLYVAHPWFIAWVGYAPILVPWSDIAVSPMKMSFVEDIFLRYVNPADAGGNEGGEAWANYLVFRFRRAPLVLLQIHKAEGLRLAAAAGGAWPGLIDSLVMPLSCRD